MSERKTYGQFCGLARALDRVGDRWTLLIVRELLLGPSRYSDLLAALPGLASNLLATRLRHLAADGLVTGGRGAPYRLTERGAALEPVISELIRWATPYMVLGPGQDRIDERWIVLALRALLEDAEVRQPVGRLLVRCAGTEVTVQVDRRGRSVRPGAPVRCDASVTGALPALLAGVTSGHLPASLTVTGDRTFASAVLGPSAEGTGRRARRPLSRHRR